MTEQITIQLPKPHKGQQQVLDSTARWKVLLTGRRFGKTLIALIICIQRMLKGEQVAYITPQFQLGKDFFKDILKYLPSQLIITDNKSELFIELKTGGTLKFFSGESLDALRGRKYHYIVIDEAAFISNLEEHWNTSIRPTLSDYEGGALFISTPKGKEYFYSLFTKGLTGEPDYESWQFTSLDNPFFPRKEWDAAKASIPSAQFKQEYEAIAGENAANPFGTEHIRNNTITTLSTEPTIVYGIDLAKYNDYTVIIGLDSTGCMSYFDRFQSPWIITQDKIKLLPPSVLKVVDASGVGDVVYEHLQVSCQNIKGFKFTAESKPKIIYELIKDVEQGNVKYNQITADEMNVYEYSYSSTGHIKFQAQSGFHDDTIAALAIANHHRNQAISSMNWQVYTA